MDVTATMEMKRAQVRIVLNSDGSGSVLVNGIEMAGVVSGIALRSSVDTKPTVVLEIRADQVELEAPDIATLIHTLRPDPAPPLEHNWPGVSGEDLPNEVCKTCKQVRRVAAPVCPGPLKS